MQPQSSQAKSFKALHINFTLEASPTNFNRNATFYRVNQLFLMCVFFLVIFNIYKEVQNHGSALYHSQCNVVLLNQNYILLSFQVGKFMNTKKQINTKSIKWKNTKRLLNFQEKCISLQWKNEITLNDQVL